MPTYAYDHLHLRSPDPSKTAQWYHRMFGARIIATPQASGPSRVDLDIGGLIIFVAGALPANEEVRGLKDPHYGLDHFGLKVQDLEQAVADLKAKGAEFAVEPRTLPTGVKIAFVRAPDDVRIELVERHP
ncbi:MAG: VOC family protein [Chloroflexi bacterium]|nr:VOC family protein [Chloroflexota bacterium]